jgi:4-oxalocrotonate tautomerase
MPFTTVKVIEGAFSREQKAQLIENITEGMIAVYGEGMRDKTWVVIEDVKAGDWAIGGKVPAIKVEQNT